MSVLLGAGSRILSLTAAPSAKAGAVVRVGLVSGVGDPPPAMVIPSKRASSLGSGGEKLQVDDKSLSLGDLASIFRPSLPYLGQISRIDETSDS